jgi:DNA primase
MSADLRTLKAAVPLPEIVTETHDIDRNGKVLCPVHDDHTPSCHIYIDGWKCYSCGAHGDAVDWLKLTHNLSTAEAIRKLERRAGGYIPPAAERRPVPPARTVIYKPVDENMLEAHRQRAAQLDQVPAAMEGRGFSPDDLKVLQIAAYGQDAVLPITGPDGTVLALKRRYAEPRDGQRYRYTTPGHGTPAWCSPDFLEADQVLICEGELNGAACWLAAPELAVMGIAGTGGALHLDVLKGRTIYCYADGDDPGQKARDKWAALALEAGGLKVYALDPWPADACDLAGTEGRAALQELLS